MGVELDTPGLDNDSGLVQGSELLGVEQLVATPAVERLDEGVLPGAAADHFVDVLERLVALRGAPEHLRMDNGPELISWALRDWCRLSHTGTIYIGVP